MESILYFLDNFTPEFLIIETALLVVIFAILVITWVYNKKRYQNLQHQIPAGVVKSYLDSIIQNSTSLKSSLFRGGGLDVSSGSIPSVLPIGQLVGGESVSISANPDDLAAKNSEIASLKAQLQEKSGQIKTLEMNLKEADGEIAELNKRIKELEGLLKNASSGGAPVAAAPAAKADNSALEGELKKVTKERDELLERLKEYEIIEDDLANLKRLQQENEQLKKALGAGGGKPAGAPAAAEAAPAAKAPTPAAEPVAAKASEAGPDPIPEAGSSGEDIPNIEGAAKSPEDLLSEFEKMLG